jgi:DNA-binding NarL/FixJ family response regulator
MAMNGNSVRRLRILAVDDEQTMLDLYRDALFLLADQGGAEYEFEVTLCKQGDEALEAVRKAKDENDPFAVIFLDLRLPPGPDGIWTGEQIRNIDPYVNFVIVTGFFDVDPREIALRIPPEDKLLYVQKPFHIQEILQFAASLGAKWHSEQLLRKAKSELEDANSQLWETNNALSVLARNLERIRAESEKRIIQRTRTVIMPIIERLQQDRNLERYRTDFELLVRYIEDLTSDLASDIKIAESLSVTELRIASMIKNGISSEEIARHLYISPSTVKTHRRNIRKKLNIHNSAINLRAYLESELGKE